MSTEKSTTYQNATFRKIGLALSGIFAAIMPVLYQSGVLDGGQAALGGAVGGAGALTAAAVLHRQQGAGLHDGPPDPLEQIQQAQQIILSQETDAVAKAEALRQLMAGTLATPDFPAPPSLAQQVLNQISPQ